MKKNILLVGYGNMGKIHKRIIDNSQNGKLIGVVDKKFAKNKLVLKNVPVFSNINQIKSINHSIDGVIISSNTDSHYKIAKYFLQNKIPVLIEKPISTNICEVNELVNYSKKNNIVLRCGLLEIYNPVFTYLNNLNTNKIKNIQIFRHSQKIVNRNVDHVIYDLLIHDLAVLFNLFKVRKLEIIAKNENLTQKNSEAVDVFIKINEVPILLSVSREAQEKLRRWSIKTSLKSYEINLLNQEIEILEKGKVELENNIIISKDVSKNIKSFSHFSEPAQIQLDRFLEDLKNKKIDKKHLDLTLTTHEVACKIFNHK